MAQSPDTVPVVQHDAHDAHFENVCLTGGVLMSALAGGLILTAIVFWWALFASHGAG
jgi:hypothetical protein